MPLCGICSGLAGIMTEQEQGTRAPYIVGGRQRTGLLEIKSKLHDPLWIRPARGKRGDEIETTWSEGGRKGALVVPIRYIERQIETTTDAGCRLAAGWPGVF